MEEATCCNDAQGTFLALYCLYFVIAVMTLHSSIVKPLRLLATFVHEMSHAVMCWLTCGEVRGIEVYNNAGGVTKFVGGCRCLITAAGYLGEAFWGATFVILSGGRKTATIAASTFIVALLISLCYSPNRTMVYLNLSYAVFTSIFVALEWYVFTPLLAYVTLLYGVFLGVYAITDIWDHLVTRTVPGSDAYVAYEESRKLCPPKCIGISWMLLAIAYSLIGLWIGLILMSDECQDSGWFQCIFSSKFDLDFPDLQHLFHTDNLFQWNH